MKNPDCSMYDEVPRQRTEPVATGVKESGPHPSDTVGV